jgi:hypothetical protein
VFSKHHVSKDKEAYPNSSTVLQLCGSSTERSYFSLTSLWPSSMLRLVQGKGDNSWLVTSS